MQKIQVWTHEYSATRPPGHTLLIVGRQTAEKGLILEVRSTRESNSSQYVKIIQCMCAVISRHLTFPITRV